MGYDAKEIRLYFRVSRHNDERDRLDNLAHEQLVHELEELVKTPEFERLRVQISAGW